MHISQKISDTTNQTKIQVLYRANRFKKYMRQKCRKLVNKYEVANMHYVCVLEFCKIPPSRKLVQGVFSSTRRNFAHGAEFFILCAVFCRIYLRKKKKNFDSL